MIAQVLWCIFCTANMKQKIFVVTVYNCKARRQVKNNITKFEGDDFMFELNNEEMEKLSRCKKFTLNTEKGLNIKYKQRYSPVKIYLYAVEVDTKTIINYKPIFELYDGILNIKSTNSS